MAVARLLIEYVIVVAGIARLARLGADDILLEPFREWAVARLPKRRGDRANLLGRGLHCRWCWAVWCAIPSVPLWWLISDAPRLWDRWYADVPVVIAGVSYLAVLIARMEPED